MGSNIDNLTFNLQTTAERRQFRAFLRPAPETTNLLRRRWLFYSPCRSDHFARPQTIQVGRTIPSIFRAEDNSPVPRNILSHTRGD